MEKELDLVRRAQRGDHDAFDELVDRYGTELFRLAVAVIGRESAADVTQDALIRGWREVPKLRNPDRFLPWMRRIVVNRCRDVARSERRASSIPIDDVPSLVERELMTSIDARTDLFAAIDALTVDQRSILALHYMLGLSIRETASTIRVSEGTAKSRLHAALERMRRMLGVSP